VALPFKIDYLLTSGRVESERLEFKTGWNPLKVMHTLCAFANDFHNLGGGYVVLGVATHDGRPVLPPAGLPADSLDRIQKDVLNLGYRMQPEYHPVIAPETVQGRTILVLWAPGGQARPYKAPVSMAKDCKEYAYFVRKGSSTVRARNQDERELLTLAATVPFDDRIRHDASLDDLDIGLIRDFLKEVGSALYTDAGRMDFTKLCRQMNIVAGPEEFLRPLNVGLLFFNEHPDRFFPYTQIDVVHFPDDPGGDMFSEKIFKGPVHRMVREALSYIRASLILETVIKHPDRPEAERFYNYPYEAIEEPMTTTRTGAFSWRRAVAQEIDRYIAELDDRTKRTIWKSTPGARDIPATSMAAITRYLAPFVYAAVLRPIHRAVANRERRLRQAENEETQT
jgi:ATP-dependent DNA helicase RecG